MSENSVEAPVGEVSQGETQQESGTGNSGNPAWSEILATIPDSLHNVVRPALEKWDRNYESGIQKVHSEYEPWKPLREAGYEPQTVQYALGLLNELENNPRAIYDALAEHNGWAAEQGQTDLAETEEDEYTADTPDDPRIARAEELSEAVASYIMEQHQQQEAAQEDAALDAEIAELKEKHGIAEDDSAAERFVMGIMLAGASAEEAFDEYVKMQNAVATRPRANDGAPAILGSGGGVPSSQIPVSELSNPKNRRALVAQMLQQAQG